MNENSITRFEVSNFKKFDHLIVENIGQVNLITGDNNVGKTTLLEALVFSEDNSFWIKYLHQRLDVRNINFHLENIHAESPKFPNENFLHYILSDIKKRLVCKFELQKGDTEELALEYRQIGDIDVELQKYRKDNYKVFNVPDWVVFYKGGKIDELQWLYRDDMDKSIRDNLYMPFISSFNSLDDDFQRNVDSLNFDEKEFVIKSLKKWIPDL
jgi:AAA15 family ATPase/GTPase